MNRIEIEAQLRSDNPTTTNDLGERHGAGSFVYESIIQKWADEMEAQEIMHSRATSRATSRAALRAQWDALPAIYRGPYRPEFEAANRMLDEGDDEGAAAIIAYAAPKAGFTETEAATFEAIKSQMAAGIAALPSPPAE